MQGTEEVSQSDPNFPTLLQGTNETDVRYGVKRHGGEDRDAADHEWFTRLGVAAIVVDKLQQLNPTYPPMTQDQRAELAMAEKLLKAEK